MTVNLATLHWMRLATQLKRCALVKFDAAEGKYSCGRVQIIWPSKLVAVTFVALIVHCICPPPSIIIDGETITFGADGNGGLNVIC